MSKEEITQELEAHFDRHRWTWNLKGQGSVHPDRYDFAAALDEGQRVLYAEGAEGGNILQVGRLIIIRQGDTFEVYVMAGTFQGEK